MSNEPMNEGELRAAFEAMHRLRKLGYAIAVFTPDELAGTSPDIIESLASRVVYGHIASNADPDAESEPLVDENMFRR